MTPPKLTTEALDAMNDDALATIAVEWKDEGRAFLDAAEQSRFELEKRLDARGATQLDTESWTGKLLSAGYTHVIEDDAALEAALEAAGVADLNKEVYVMPPMPAPRWNHRALNELHKLGGKVAEAIDQYRRATPNRKKLELKAKPDAGLEGGRVPADPFEAAEADPATEVKA